MARRKRKHKQILWQEEGTCYLCALFGDNSWKFTHGHHIYPGANRRISEQEGFVCRLCVQHHTEGPEAVHSNITNMRIIQMDAQREYEKTHTRQQFMDLIGRSYLDDEEPSGD